MSNTLRPIPSTADFKAYLREQGEVEFPTGDAFEFDWLQSLEAKRPVVFDCLSDKDWKKNGNWKKKEEALPMFDRNKVANLFLTKPDWWLKRPNTEVTYNECWHCIVGANTYIRLVPTEEEDDFTLTLAFNTTYNDFSSSCSTTYLMDSRDIIYGWECSECSNKNIWSSFQCSGNDCCSERGAHAKISIGNEIGWHKVGYDKRSENPRWILGHSKRRELKYYDIEAMIQSKEMFQTKTVEEEDWNYTTRTDKRNIDKKFGVVETISWQPVDHVPYEVPNNAIILKKESIPDDVTIIETPCGTRSHKPFDCPIEITFLVEGATSSQSDQWQGVVEGASVTRNGATGKFKKAIQTSSGLSISIEAQLSSQFTKDVDFLQSDSVTKTYKIVELSSEKLRQLSQPDNDEFKTICKILETVDTNINRNSDNVQNLKGTDRK